MHASLVTICAVVRATVALPAQSERQATSRSVEGGIVVRVDREQGMVSPGSVAIDGGNAVAVDDPQTMDERYEASRVIDARDQIVLPGLTNTHTHVPMVIYRGLAENLANGRFLMHDQRLQTLDASGPGRHSGW